jgi:5'(3')-deoxyribonucleotidase
MDVDGPLTRGFFTESCALLRELDVFAHPFGIDRWNIFEAFKATKVQERLVRDQLCRPGVALRFKPNHGAVDAVLALSIWADIFAVTAPLDGSPTWAYDREAWLCDHFGFEPSQIISARNKHVILGDAFVDDKVESLIDWSQSNPQGLAILWVEPHNRTAAWEGPRVRTYEELFEILEPLRRRQ